MGKKRGQRGLSVYTNLSNRRKANKDAASRRKAEYLATLPKHPVKRFFYRLHPKRFFTYWFSRQGAFMALKVASVGVLLMVLLLGALVAYYSRELDSFRPNELSKRVQTTVTKYYDRNNVLLWEDKGDGDYKLVVDSKDISKYMKDATVSIEDKDFFKHGGFSLTGIIRAAVSNSGTNSGGTQGGSTLTQQLVKQVFLSSEAQDRGLSGIPRKIKEVILSVQVERAYTKDQILTLYLNESSYGGPRNGVESAAQSYFHKSAKDLTLPESALLASIPQSPTRFNPASVSLDPDDMKALIARKDTTLDYMAEQGYITSKEAADAKKVAVLDSVQPDADRFKDIKAPHFVQMVKAELEQKLGKKVMGEGGLTIKTTLDWRVQQVVDQAIVDLFNGPQPKAAGFDNAAATVVDAPTGQILGLRGSRDYNYGGYGYVNAATSYLQPGSSIKPFVYASLFEQKSGANYGVGSILSDEPLPQSIYTTEDGKSVQNFDNEFRGALPIRNLLPESRNIPAIKALYINDQINGQGATLKEIHKFGDISYCTVGQETQVGLGAAIGSCSVKQTEHADTFATLARSGVYKPVADVLEVKNSQGQTIQQWKDEGVQVLDPQVTYMLNDVLSDDSARVKSFGARARGLYIPGVRSGAKTGTSNLGNKSRDLWINNYSPKAVVSVWAGNHNGAALNDALSYRIGPTVAAIMGPIHTDIFEKDGTWKPTDWYAQPAGIQKLTIGGRTDIYPSWFKQSSATSGEKIVFDKVSHKKATSCTPEAAKIEVTVQKTVDPVTKKTTYINTGGYDATANDDVHQCGEQGSTVNITTLERKKNQFIVTVDRVKYDVSSVTMTYKGQSLTATACGSNKYCATNPSNDTSGTVTVTVIDSAFYETTATYQ